MKTTNVIRNLIAWSLVTSCSSQLFAKSLMEYRGSQGPTIQAKVREDLSEVFNQMGANKVSSIPVKGLVDPVSNSNLNTKPRLNFATLLKRFLEAGKTSFKFDEQLGRPTTFSPAWSVEKSKFVKNQRHQFVCENLIAKFDVNKLLESLNEAAQESKISNYANINVDSRQQNILKKIETALNSGSQNTPKKSLMDILGHPIAVDVVDGYIQEIHFSKANNNFNDNNTVSVNISMLISLKTGNEEYYIQAQQCLTQYLQEQFDILEIRKAELTRPDLAKKIDKWSTSLRDLFDRFQRDANSRDSKVTWDKFYEAHLKMLAGEDAAADYLVKRDKYLLGRNLSPADEVRKIDLRLSQIKNVMPYLKEKLTGSLFAHRALGKLSDEQLNGLLAFTLNLQGSNIPTEADMQILTKGIARSGGSGEVEVDYMRYKATLDELNNLKMRLQELHLPAKVF